MKTRKILSFVLAGALAVSVSGNAFAFSLGTGTGTTMTVPPGAIVTLPKVPDDSSTSTTTPSNPASASWSLDQRRMNLQVGQSISVNVSDPSGQLESSSTIGTSNGLGGLVSIGGGSTIMTGGLTFAPSTGSGSTSTSGGLVWTSSDEGVATVQDGVVTAKKLGRAIITATAADGSSQSCVAHVALKGIDVSSWQKTLDWSAVAASGIDFAMIRTGYGSENWADQTDAYFEANYNGATSNGIAVGVYHYSYATTPEAARQEAQMCLSILNGRKLDFPVAFDIEDASQKSLTPEQAAEIVIAFCDTIEQAGYDAAIYSYTNFYTSKLTDPRLDKYDKWVAHWGVDNPRYNGNLSIWQYGSAPVAGASGNVDMNYCYVDYAGVLQGSGEVSNLSAAE